MERRRAVSNLEISGSASDRRSTFIEAFAGMEFTEVPPSIVPTLNVVLGLSGAGVFRKCAIPRARALMGLATPKSDQLWPPGPVMVISTRREAKAAVVT